MRVILNADVTGLGEEGDVRDVKAGYARNYLIPQQLALPHTAANVRAIERRAVEIEARKQQKRTDAASLKERLEGELLVFEVAAGDTGKLFGSISNANIAAELDKMGYGIERRRIDVPGHSLRTTGEHSAAVRLYDREGATLSIRIDRSRSDASRS